MVTELKRFDNKYNQVRNYYEELYRKLGKSMRSPKAYKPFLECLGIRPNTKLLDLSCGGGGLLQCLSGREGCFGLDISQNAIQMAKRISPHAQYVVGDAHTLPYKNDIFNYCTTIGSLEHLFDASLALSEVIRVSKNDAKFCIVVPNSNFWIYKLFRMKGTNQSNIREKLASLAEWKELLRGNGFAVLHVKHDKGPDITSEGIWGIPKGLIRKTILLLNYVLPLRWTYQFVIICEKQGYTS